MVIQHKTHQPVRFELTEQTRDAAETWIGHTALQLDDYLFPSRVKGSPHLSTRQYARIVKGWAAMIGRNPKEYGTHSLRRTKATLVYRRTKNLRAVQLLLGHTKLESTVRYLGIEVDDALEISEQTESWRKERSARRWALSATSGLTHGFEVKQAQLTIELADCQQFRHVC